MGIDLHRCSSPLVTRFFVLKLWSPAFESIDTVAGSARDVMRVPVPADNTFALCADFHMIRTAGNTHDDLSRNSETRRETTKVKLKGCKDRTSFRGWGGSGRAGWVIDVP